VLFKTGKSAVLFLSSIPVVASYESVFFFCCNGLILGSKPPFYQKFELRW
jgi:hypothetical protein